MPVEIKELIIRAIVTEGETKPESKKSLVEAANEREEIVADCVRRVMQILKDSKER
ncbi:MAG: hypothetical protein KDA88_06400 [Planctomycetaceae bacterium]|nr:hypothetical protein [Planctomycetaceae bacterium]MCB9950069.1 hypothetical protein [Planctomycetaceae bacterium]